MRLEIVTDIAKNQERTGLSLTTLLKFYEIKKSTYHGWVSFPQGLPKKLVTENIASARSDEIEAVLRREILESCGRLTKET